MSMFKDDELKPLHVKTILGRPVYCSEEQFLDKLEQATTAQNSLEIVIHRIEYSLKALKETREDFEKRRKENGPT